MNILETLIIHQNSIPDEKTYNKMIRTILANIGSVKNSTIYDVADMCYTSTASVSRLCTILGYGSFTDFRKDIAETLENYDFYNNMLPNFNISSAGEAHREMSNVLLQQAETFKKTDPEIAERVAELFHTKDDIHFFVHYYNPLPYMSLQQNLSLDGKQTYYHHSEEECKKALESINEKSAVFITVPDLHRENPMHKLFLAAKESGASVVVFLTKDRTCWQEADIKVVYESISSPLSSHMSAYFLALLSSIYRMKFVKI